MMAHVSKVIQAVPPEITIKIEFKGIKPLHRRHKYVLQFLEHAVEKG